MRQYKVIKTIETNDGGTLSVEAIYDENEDIPYEIEMLENLLILGTNRK